MDSTEKVLQFIADSGMSDAQFTREAGLSNGLIGQWRSGKQKASLKNLQKIADRFELDISTFLESESTRVVINPQKAEPDWVEEIKKDPRKEGLMKRLAKMDDETRLKIEKIIDMLEGE